MKRKIFRTALLCLAVLSFAAQDALAQKYPERRMIRQGNRDYSKGHYAESEIDYRRALEKNPESYEARFNLGNSLYRQEQFDEAQKVFSRLGKDTSQLQYSSGSHYNAGNAHFQQRNLQEALEEYKDALRRNPDDMDAKFNLAYVRKLLENENGGGGGGNDDQNDDQNDDKDNQDNNDDQNNNDNQDGQGDNDQNDDRDDDGNDPQDNEQPSPSGMTREEAERMLEAMQQAEDKTKEKMDERKAATVQQSGRNW